MNPLENQRAADVPAGVYQDLEERLMANIIKHCRDYNQPIATDVWLLRKMAEIGKLNQENIKIIAQSTGLSQTAMERMLNDAAEQAVAEMEPAMQRAVRRGLLPVAEPVEKSRNVKQALSTMQKQAKDTLNLCNTTMLYKASEAYKQFVYNVTSKSREIVNKPDFLDILNKNATAAMIGAESRQQAMKKCISEFNDRGIPAFVDKRGREWTPEAYVNMAMRSTSNTMAAEAQMARADDYGIDLIEVDSHSGARPKCAKDQGKIFDRSNKSTKYLHWNTSSYGEPDGLLGINCGHHIYPYVEGVSIRRHFPTEDMDANDKLYRETQKQRALERDVRKQKRECMLYDQIGDDEAFADASVKLKSKEAKLKAYVNGNPDLHRRKDREQVVGFDKGVSSKAVAANKKTQKEFTGDSINVRSQQWERNRTGQRVIRKSKTVEKVQNVQNASTLDEVNTIASKKLGLKVDFSNCTLEYAKEQVTWYEKLKIEYNQRMNVTQFGTSGIFGKDAVAETFISPDYKYATITVSGKNAKPSTLDKLHSYNVVVDEKNANISDLTHEFAHTITASKGGDEGFWKEIKSIKNRYNRELTKIEKANIVDKTLSYEESIDKKKEIFISEYANKSVDEFMAEAFSEAKLSSNPSPYSKQVLDVVNKYFKKESVEKIIDNDIIKPDKMISGHEGAPKKADPGMIIDHIGENSQTETRTFYGESGYKKKDITNHDHGFPKKHPYGKNGEHAHDYEWDAEGKLKNRTTREITDDERKENSDIL